MPAESVNWDSTENLIIEGDNLEVLKLLQKPYHGKVKMIYIDPPYNTGNEFIYPDNFREGLDEYLRYTGQLNDDGTATSTNKDTSGRYHSNWLNMMYPRLFLARNLLKEDGVIFVSIDDHEVHNLRLLMDEVFGEENFVANVVWQKKQSPQNDAINISDMHDHILVYARRAKQDKSDTEGWQRNFLPREEEQEGRYENPDNDPRGAWTSADLTCNKTAGERPNLFFPIINPSSGEEIWPTQTRVWGYEKSLIETLMLEGRLWWGKSGKNFPRLKKYRTDVNDGVVPSTWWSRDKAGDNQEAKREIRALFPECDIFDTPKPVRLIKRMLQIATGKPAQKNSGERPLGVMEAPARYAVNTKTEDTHNSVEKLEQDIVLDFFAGSGTTAHAVLDLNQQDGGNRKFILVQLPEKTDNPQYPTIAHITRERVRRVIVKLGEKGTQASPQLTLSPSPSPASVRGEPTPRPLAGEGGRRPGEGGFGFRAFKLDSSNFKIWRSDKAPQSAEQLAEQLSLYADNVLAERSEQDRLYELILKCGMPLSARVEEIQLPVRAELVEARPSTGSGRTAFSIADGNLLICLESHLDRDTLRALFARKPQMVLCLDTAFDGNDALKTNTVLEAQTHGIIFKTV
ncbi:MAG: site-specific DNA-methyltransferase [Nitrosomonadales bacterium]|nr:site-specific DNA-methyltransferase [Nitrosomonadales bacterium]